GDRLLGRDALEDRGPDPVPPLLATVRGAAAAGQERRALGPAELDVAEDPLQLLGRDQRPDPRLRVERVAGLEASGTLDDLRDELVVDRLVDQEPRAGRARLARVVEDPAERAPGRGLEVRVGEDDVRRLAAQLERDRLHRFGRLAHDLLPDLGRARERDLVDARVAD